MTLRHRRLPSWVCQVVLLATILAPCSAQNQSLQLLNGVSNDHVDVSYDPSLVPQTGLTLEAWITFDDTTLGASATRLTAVRQNPLPNAQSYELRVNLSGAGILGLQWVLRTETNLVVLDWPFFSGQLQSWTHVCGTYDGSRATLYVNGTPRRSATATGKLIDSGNVLRIGNGDTVIPGQEVWNGGLDEVRLWPFARTRQEIVSTMNLELSGIPGEVSTWNFNGGFQDSSASNDGQSSGAVAFVMNGPAVQAFPSSAALSFGNNSAGCSGSPVAGVTSIPQLGNASFAFDCVRAPRNSSGVLFLAGSPLPGPLPFLGVELWVDIGSAISIPVSSNGMAVSRTTLPIPANTLLTSASFSAQYLWLDLACAAGPLLTSDGVTVVLQP